MYVATRRLPSSHRAEAGRRIASGARARRLRAFGRWRRYASGADSVVATRGTFNKKTCISSTMTILMPIALLCREYYCMSIVCLNRMVGTLRCF